MNAGGLAGGLSGGPLTIRPMTERDDLDAEFDLRHRAFGAMDAAQRAYRVTEVGACIADGRQFGAWDSGGPMIGSARFYDLRQWWHGRALPAAGVAGVKVAPEARGLGVGRALMTGLLRAMADRGYALSVLYPATAHLYRSLGWELAGGRYIAQVPARSLGSLLPADAEAVGGVAAGGAAVGGAAAGAEAVGGAAVGVGGAAGIREAVGGGLPERPDVRRAVPDDAERVLAVLGSAYAGARDCGPCTWDAASVRRWLADADLFAYLAGDGFLGYGWDGGHHEMMVHVLRASSARTARALWGIVASHASMARVVRAAVGPADAVGWLTPEPDVSLSRPEQWMLRVLDPVAAVAGRGFPAGLDVQVPLVLADPELPAVAGSYTLTVIGGTGRLRPAHSVRGTASDSPERGSARARAGSGAGPAVAGPAVAGPARAGPARAGSAVAGPAGAGSAGAGPVALGPRGFAAMFAGVPMATLRLAGLAAGGDPGADEALDAVFAAQPYLLDYF